MGFVPILCDFVDWKVEVSGYICSKIVRDASETTTTPVMKWTTEKNIMESSSRNDRRTTKILGFQVQSLRGNFFAEWSISNDA